MTLLQTRSGETITIEVNAACKKIIALIDDYHSGEIPIMSILPKIVTVCQEAHE